MHKEVKLRVRKDLNPKEQSTVIKLKGSLISKGYTQIIHIMDQDEEFHLNIFETPLEKADEVKQFISAFITAENLLEIITII